MTASELVRSQLDESAYQLRKVFEGLTEPDWNFRLHSRALTPIETAIHLADCCRAFVAFLGGNKYQWDSYQPDPEGPDSVLSDLWRFRDQAISHIGEEARSLNMATSFLILHESYHIGQMAMIRAELDANFDSGSLYYHD